MCQELLVLFCTILKFYGTSFIVYHLGSPGSPGGHVKQNFLEFHEYQNLFSKVSHQMPLRVKCNTQQQQQQEEEEEEQRAVLYQEFYSR